MLKAKQASRHGAETGALTWLLRRTQNQEGMGSKVDVVLSGKAGLSGRLIFYNKLEKQKFMEVKIEDGLIKL